MHQTLLLMLRTSLLSVILLLVLPACKTQNAGSPDEVLDQYLSTNTAFTDAMYGNYTVNSFFASGMANTTIDIYNPDYGLLNAAVFYETNKYRQSKGKSFLKFSSALRNAAFYHAYAMAEMNFYSHKSKVKGMKDVADRVAYFNYPTAFVGENIDFEFLYNYTGGTSYSYEQVDGKMVYLLNGREGAQIPVYTYAEFAQAIVKEWINSAAHRANMLSNDYAELGCGVFPDRDEFGGLQIPEAAGVQVFGNTGIGTY